MATTTWTYDEIEAALERREREGLSWRTLAEHTGHPVSRLRYVARRLEARYGGRGAGFVEVAPSRRATRSESLAREGRITIELAAVIRLLLEGDIDLDTLRELLHAAGESC